MAGADPVGGFLSPKNLPRRGVWSTVTLILGILLLAVPRAGCNDEQEILQARIGVEVRWRIPAEEDRYEGYLNLVIRGSSELTVHGEYAKDPWTRLLSSFGHMTGTISFRNEYFIRGKPFCKWQDEGRFSLSEDSRIDKRSPWQTPIILSRETGKPYEEDTLEFQLSPRTSIARIVPSNRPGLCPPMELLEQLSIAIKKDMTPVMAGKREWTSYIPPWSALTVDVCEHPDCVKKDYAFPSRSTTPKKWYRYSVDWDFLSKTTDDCRDAEAYFRCVKKLDLDFWDCIIHIEASFSPSDTPACSSGPDAVQQCLIGGDWKGDPSACFLRNCDFGPLKDAERDALSRRTDSCLQKYRLGQEKCSRHCR